MATLLADGSFIAVGLDGVPQLALEEAADVSGRGTGVGSALPVRRGPQYGPNSLFRARRRHLWR